MSVVTFNYDRSLEHYLFTALPHRDILAPGRCADLMANIPIVHVHGALGSLPWQKATFCRTYRDDITRDTLATAVAGITLPDEVGHGHRPDGFQRAQEYLKEAARVCFLGFGYDERNVDRLGLESVPVNATLDLAFWGMTEKQCNTAARHVRTIVWREGKKLPHVIKHPCDTNDGILGFLGRTDVLS